MIAGKLLQIAEKLDRARGKHFTRVVQTATRSRARIVQTCYLLFEARSADVVREAARRADLPFDRVAEAVGA